MAVRYEELEEIRLKINAFYEQLRIFIPGYILCLRHAREMADAYRQYFNRPHLERHGKTTAAPSTGIASIS